MAESIDNHLEDVDNDLRQILRTIEAALRGLCQKMRSLRENESFESTFYADGLRNFTTVVQHLPDILDMVFENVMSEEVDAYIMNKPGAEMMDEFLGEICYGNRSSVLLINPGAQQALQVLCHMDWYQLSRDFMGEVVLPNMQDKHDTKWAAENVKCIYDNIMITNWTNIIDVSGFNAMGAPNLDNL